MAKANIVCRGYGSPHGYAKGRQWFVCGKCRWHITDNEEPIERDERDEAYERAASRARGNDFADTGGKDWT